VNSLVSIIIPAYNVGNYVQQTLDSVIAQTYSDWECLVIDDGSTDNTAELVMLYVNKDSRVRYFHKPNGGLCSTRNYGLTLCKGQYIQFLDGDDILFKEKLARMVNQYERCEEKGMILFCDYIYGTENDPYTENDKYHKLFSNFNRNEPMGFKEIYMNWDSMITIPIHCLLYPATRIKGIFFDEQLKSKEDWNYHLAVLSEGNHFLPYNYKGCAYRVSHNSMSKSYTAMITASLTVLNRWKTNRALYFYRVSFFFLQAYIYKSKGYAISIKAVVNRFKADNRFYLGSITIVNLLVPFVLLFKMVNSFRIRMQ
jgi:glycosyltransferase involved in cell wall biosynthesis